MKKIIGFFLLLILAGAAFFFGWAQLPVAPGSYGVLRSKTHGVDAAPIREGEFRWIWYKLIPTNAVTLVFKPAPVTRELALTGSLPQGETYAAAAGLGADFSYEISGTLSFTIKAASLPSLVQERGLTDQESLEVYEKELGRNIEAFAMQRLEAYSAEENALEGILKSPAASRLEGEILREFPDIENLSCVITRARLPDLALYSMARSVYKEYLNSQQELLKTEIAGQAERNINSLFRFDELEKYGELLTRYPVLLQYLAMPKP
ncbi:conserved hypothetical protein [Treponema primitia ZAS-2]|uniref:Band 7 domain-containing protein n=1 Tax=Treponema primitia (strain ATCC BAA-887 / DSM 12427 / ZAS-2) TaxID=545694 RepID=F5YHG1_TREPZ|nr:hypothetical protein [Treponema primitia]AEF85355.1 conserved hypothetical protein [Treponema primitia ZAS-2]